MENQYLAYQNMMRDANHQLENLYLSAMRLLEVHSLEDTYTTIIEEALELINGQYASIFIWENGLLRRVCTSDPILYRITPRPNGATYKTFMRNKPNLRLGSTLEKQHPAFKHIKVGSDITMPLTYKNTTTGVLSILSYPDVVFTRRDLNVIRYFTPLASLSIQTAQNQERLQQAIDDRNMFISVASHELRSPLTSAIGYVQLMALMLKKEKPITKDTVTKLHSVLQQLRRLINDFLQVDKIKKGLFQYRMRPWSLLNIINNVSENFMRRHPEHQIIIKNDLKGSSTIKGDRTKLQQVFSNLLNNAHKYAPDEKPITIHIHENPTSFLVDLKDRGIGIPDKDIPHLFTKFRIGSLKNTSQGMGLGLFLAKTIIDAHHGTISVSSKINQGSTFHITLPKTAKYEERTTNP
jgi:signal transduction histidine kinase